jgi:hypothetical protein
MAEPMVMAPQWHQLSLTLLSVLARLTAGMGCGIGDLAPTCLRLYVPEDFPPPWPGSDVRTATIYGIRVEITDAVTRPVLGVVLD